MNADRPPADGDPLLIEYLRDRDAPCPLCGYNLRSLQVATCPECRETLSLAVGFRKPRFGWFVAAIIPGSFSGICAALLLMPLVGSLLSPSPPAPWPFWAIDVFGWLSVLAAFVLARYRYAFLRQPQGVQCASAVAVWAIHILAFVGVLSFLAGFP